MEKTVLSPCFKYLIRHAAKSEKELLRFAKMFFSLCNSRKISAEDAVRQYTSLRISLVGINNAVDILSYKGEVLSPSDFRNAVMSDDSIPAEPSCSEYTKSVLGDNSICRLCRYTSGTYSNENIENEYKVLRYIYESAMNLGAFKDNGNNASFFQGEVDLAKELSYDYPVVVSLNRECGYKLVSSKSKPAQQFFRLALPVDQRLSNLEYGARMPLLRQNPRVDDLCLINPNVIQTAWRDFIKKVSSYDVISNEEFYELIEKGKRRKRPKKKGPEYYPSVYESMVAFVESIDEKKRAKSAPTVPTEDVPVVEGTVVHTPADTEPVPMNEPETEPGILEYDSDLSNFEEAMSDVKELQQELEEEALSGENTDEYCSTGMFNESVEDGFEGYSDADIIENGEGYSDSDIISDDSDDYSDGDIAFSMDDGLTGYEDEVITFDEMSAADEPDVPFEETEPSTDEPVDSDEVSDNETPAAEESVVAEDTAASDEEEKVDEDFFRVAKDDDGWATYDGSFSDDYSDDGDGVTGDTDEAAGGNETASDIEEESFEEPAADNGQPGQDNEASGNDDALLFDELASPIVMSFEELDYISKLLDKVPEKDARSRSVAMEVLYCDGEYYLLFYFFRSRISRYVKASSLADSDSVSGGVAKRLLSGKARCIITYQPYYIYSLARIYGFRVHNLYSIYSVDRLLFPDEKVAPRTKILRPYADGKTPEWKPSCTAMTSLSFMPLYAYIKSRQMLHCEDTVTPSNLASVMSFDELMGYSYLTSDKTYEPLFDIADNGELLYVRTVPAECGEQYVGYEVTEGNPHLFMYYCLMGYTDADKLWASKAYIYSVDGKKVVMYMPDSTREKCMTEIGQLYYDYGIGHRDEKILLDIT